MAIVLPPQKSVAFTTAATLADSATAKLAASSSKKEFTSSPS